MTYEKYAHRLNMRWVDVAKRFHVEPYLIERTISEIDIRNTEAILSSDKPNLLLPYPHSTWTDTYLVPFVFLNYGLPPPITVTGNNIFIKSVFKRFGCSIFDRDKPVNTDYIKYLASVFSEEHRDVVCYSGFIETEDGQKKTGRNWNGKLQKMTPLPLLAALTSYKNGVDVNVFLVIMAYEPHIPEEAMFEILMDGTFSKKLRYQITNKLGGKYADKFIDWFNTFIFPPKREITAHISFHGPYPISQLYERFYDSRNPVREMNSFLEKEAHHNIMITPRELDAAAILRSNGNGRNVSDLGFKEHARKKTRDVFNGMIGEKSDEIIYENSEIGNNVAELKQLLSGICNTSLISDDFISQVKKSRHVFEINDYHTIVKDDVLLHYYGNQVNDLIKLYSPTVC